MGEIVKMPYPKTAGEAAKRAVESAFAKLGASGAFEESGGLSDEAMIFGEACALEAIVQLNEAALDFAAANKMLP